MLNPSNPQLLVSYSRVLPILLTHSVFNYLGTSAVFKQLVDTIKDQTIKIFQRENILEVLDPAINYAYFWVNLRNEINYDNAHNPNIIYYENACALILRYFYEAIINFISCNEEFFYDEEEIKAIDLSGKLAYKLNAPKVDLLLEQLDESCDKILQSSKISKEIMFEALLSLVLMNAVLKYLPQRMLDIGCIEHYKPEIEDLMVGIICKLLTITEKMITLTRNQKIESELDNLSDYGKIDTQNIYLYLTSEFLSNLVIRWFQTETWNFKTFKRKFSEKLQKKNFEESFSTILNYVLNLFKLPGFSKSSLTKIMMALAGKYI